MLYCPGKGHELLSALGVTVVMPRLLITLGPTTMQLISKMRQLLTKVLLEREKH